MLPVYGRQRGLCYPSKEGGVVLDGRQRGLCYLFMGGREDYVNCVWEIKRTMLPV